MFSLNLINAIVSLGAAECWERAGPHLQSLFLSATRLLQGLEYTGAPRIQGKILS